MTDTKYTLSHETITKLKEFGWDFVPTGPDEWGWIKFDKDGEAVAQGGEPEWADDLTAAIHG